MHMYTARASYASLTPDYPPARSVPLPPPMMVAGLSLLDQMNADTRTLGMDSAPFEWHSWCGSRHCEQGLLELACQMPAELFSMYA